MNLNIEAHTTGFKYQFLSIKSSMLLGIYDFIMYYNTINSIEKWILMYL